MNIVKRIKPWFMNIVKGIEPCCFMNIVKVKGIKPCYFMNIVKGIKSCFCEYC